MFIDTHTHLYAEEFKEDRSELIKSAIEGGINKFYLPNIDASSIESMLQLESTFPDHCFPMMGLHPCSVNATFKQQLATVKGWLEKRKFLAIGEIGMDLYWDKTYIKEQEEAFRIQIDWAIEYNYAISIHCRDAFEPIYNILSALNVKPRGIFHCFSGTLEQAERALSLGNFKLGVGGVVTFKNAGLDKVIEHVDIKQLVLETDAPYLAPVPYRGKRNEPLYLLEIAKKVSEIKGVTMDELARISSKNADLIFNYGKSI